MLSPNKVRISFYPKNPNPLFVSALERWIDEANRTASDRNILETLQLALESLRKYPLPLNSGQECLLLKGFDQKLCEMLTLEKDSPRKRYLPDPIANSKLQLSIIKDKLESEIRLEKRKPVRRKPVRKPPPQQTVKSELPAGTFDIILLIDVQEIQVGRQVVIDNALQKTNVTYEVKSLGVGDYTWIARDRFDRYEVILPYIVERKRMDDLAKSIKDKRFKEQKFRLKNSGIANLIYLIEGCDSRNDRLGLPLQTVLQAARNTLIQDHFNVKYTKSLTESMGYLATLTSILIDEFKDKTLKVVDKFTEESVQSPNGNHLNVMDFKYFNQTSRKLNRFTVGQLFLRQLIQLKGLSIEKGVAITSVYSTPFNLMAAYRQCDGVTEASHLLANIRFGKPEKSIGNKISEIIYNFFMN